MTELRTGRPRVRVPAKEKVFYFLQNLKNVFVAQPNFCSTGTVVSLREYGGREVKLTTPF
jgi:hypothetical protein